MSKDNLLKEGTIRRFWKLANINPINEMSKELAERSPKMKKDEDLDEVGKKMVKKDEELDERSPMKKDEELDERSPMKKDEDLDEVGKVGKKAMMKKDDDLEEGSGMMMGRDEEEDMNEELEEEPDMGAMDAGPEEDVDAEVSVPESDVESLRAARDVIDQILSAADGGGLDDEMGDDEEVDLSDDEEPAPMEEEFSDLDEEALDGMIESITQRVSKRIVREALVRKLTK